jgi:inner membrane transporter RhtA
LCAILGSTASFQVGAAAAKSLFPLIGAEGAAALRLALGAVLMLALFRPWRTWPEGEKVWPLLCLGVTLGGTIQFFYLAVERLPLGAAIAIQFLGPLAVAILNSRRPTDFVWALLAAGGVWALVGPSEGVASLDPVGLFWAFAAAAGWGLHIVVGRVATLRFGAVTAPIAVTLAALLILPFGVAEAGGALVSPAILPWAVLVALFSTVIPISLEFYAMPRLPARTFAVLMSLEPAFGVLAGFILLGEVLAGKQVLGVGMVMLAAAGASYATAAQKPAEPKLAELPPN